MPTITLLNKSWSECPLNRVTPIRFPVLVGIELTVDILCEIVELLKGGDKFEAGPNLIREADEIFVTLGRDGDVG